MVLKIENASFNYKNSKKIIDNLNFQAESGDLIAILGPNGAGKTTLLRCVMGFLRFCSGKSVLNGEDMYKIPPKKLWNKISYVPQARGVASSLSAQDMILLGMASKIGVFSSPSAKDVDKAVKVATSLGIEHLMQKKCNEMSGGELQMILIARALISEPELLILDEPESNLDFRNQLIVLETLSKLASEGMCVIFNTHYPEHALTRANKALILHKGGKTIFGDTQKIVTEENIRAAFGVNTVISEIETPGNTYKSIMPIDITAKSLKQEEQIDSNTIAVVSVIFESYALGNKVNEIFSKYADYIIGRMGMPYNKSELYIINVTVDAPLGEIESLKHELSILPGINVKATVADRKQGGY